MKITAPKSPGEYLSATEHAVRHFYNGLDSCWSYYQEALQHWDISKVGQPMTPQRNADLRRYLELAEKFFDLKLSEATFAGAILQVAHMGIMLYSRNKSVPPSCSGFVVPTNGKVTRFCIGPERHGLPIGLIIYAARNQYNHWDEDEPYKATRAVFDTLTAAFYESSFSDLAFDLSNETINIYANEILLTALGWTTYDIYVDQMTGLLNSAAGSQGRAVDA